jgi:hypothetical protein
MKKEDFINKRSRAVKRGEVTFDEHGRPLGLKEKAQEIRELEADTKKIQYMPKGTPLSWCSLTAGHSPGHSFARLCEISCCQHGHDEAGGSPVS